MACSTPLFLSLSGKRAAQGLQHAAHAPGALLLLYHHRPLLHRPLLLRPLLLRRRRLGARRYGPARGGDVESVRLGRRDGPVGGGEGGEEGLRVGGNGL